MNVRTFLRIRIAPLELLELESELLENELDEPAGLEPLLELGRLETLELERELEELEWLELELGWELDELG